MHHVYLLLGSNIDPVANIHAAIQKLHTCCSPEKQSRIWETEAYGNLASDNFLNLVVLLKTELSLEELKESVIRRIENELDRVRTEDKNAARTIDLDILIFDDQVIDEHIWDRAFIAIPLADLLPQLTQPGTDQTLIQISAELSKTYFSVPRPDLL